jgi:hypothetical protein
MGWIVPLNSGFQTMIFQPKNKEQEMLKTSQGLYIARASDYIHITTVYFDGVF